MFIEKLTDEDIKQLMSKFVRKAKLIEIERQERCICVSYATKEFDIVAIIENFDVHVFAAGFDTTSPKTTRLFKLFMLEKFGDEYKQAFNENLRKKYESEMIK